MSSNIILWLDDERPMPKDYTHHAKTEQEAIDLLSTGSVIQISLDYDLGWGGYGDGVAKYIADNAHQLPKMRVYVHSQSLDGREKIKKHLRNAKLIWMQA